MSKMDNPCFPFDYEVKEGMKIFSIVEMVGDAKRIVFFYNSFHDNCQPCQLEFQYICFSSSRYST